MAGRRSGAEIEAARWGVFGLTIFLPLLFNPAGASVVLIKEVVGTVAAPALAGLLALAAARSGRPVWPRSAAWLPLAAIAALALPAALRSPFGYPALIELARVEAGWLLAAVGLAVLSAPGAARTYFRLAAGIAAAVSVYALAQAVRLDFWGWTRPLTAGSFATFGHPNFLADYLLVLVFPVAVLGWQGWRAGRGRWPAAAAPLMLAAMILTRSTGGLLGLAAGVFVLAVIELPRRGRLAIGAAAGTALVVIPWLLAASGPGRAFVRSNLFRIETWRGAARIFLAHPLTGAGLGSYSSLFPEYRAADFIRRFRYAENLLHAHCEYLERAAEEGLLGLAAFFFLAAVVAAVARRRLPQLPAPDRQLAAAALAGLAAGAVHNAVCVNWRWAGPWFSACLTLGATLALLAAPPAGRRPAPLSAWGRRAAGALAAAALVWTVAAGALGAVRLKSDDAYYRGKARLFEPDKGPAIAALAEAVAAEPGNVAARYDLAYAYSQAGRHAEALTEYRGIAAVSPHYQRLHRNTAVSLLALGRLTEARRELEAAIAVDAEEANLYTLAVVAAERGDPDALERHLTFLEVVLPLLRDPEAGLRPGPRPGLQVRPHEQAEMKIWAQESLETVERLTEALPPGAAEGVWVRLGRARPGDGTP